jgi:hypothetical protein
VLCVTPATLQDLYVALPVPMLLRSGENAGSFAFLEKDSFFQGLELLSARSSSSHNLPAAAATVHSPQSSRRAHRLRRLA